MEPGSDFLTWMSATAAMRTLDNGEAITSLRPARCPRSSARSPHASCLLLVVLVALARIILRAHWPVDTLAGIALGLALASLATLLADIDPASDTRPAGI